jgi:hypothetical protein
MIEGVREGALMDGAMEGARTELLTEGANDDCEGGLRMMVAVPISAPGPAPVLAADERVIEATEGAFDKIDAGFDGLR